MNHIMSYKIFENYKESRFFIINIDNRSSTFATQRSIMTYGYMWPSNGNFLINDDKIYLICYPDKKSLAYLNKRWTEKEELEKEKSKAMFYVTAEEFLDNPEKYMSEV